VEFGDCGGCVLERPPEDVGNFAGDLLVEFEGRRGWLRIGEPCGGCGGGGSVSARAFAVSGVYFGKAFHSRKYATGCGSLDVTTIC
jgi:hypothetical protein